ncbi:threonine aldolase family protein [Actinomadura macrotermitis]|uniref:Low specificity L-threonine aldolase n=1 Tax=Actinomadura macrotermitis TaxID=2585200 RepID=A0A7K0C7L3_9ACTN|nr:low specificity L-threonine aldolase [Actinomadura macrotermitis]MQY09408.1 Low specificity L-threonine aldolase [Actinomadura macrotermitis]
MTSHTTDPARRGFASDNHAGVHPEVLSALAAANAGHQPAYGDDAHTARLAEIVRRHFGERAAAYPVFNGTGANVVALRAMAAPWSSVVCGASAHIHVDECGAPERIAGLKLLPVPAPDGKLTPALVEPQLIRFGDVHQSQPGIVAISQATECGTVYTPAEVAALADLGHEHGMLLYMDGARAANAAAALDVPLRAFTTDAGVDVLAFGGTKNGLMMGEAVVVLNPDAVRGLEYLRKQSMQLASKMRFVSAQLNALLEGDLWLRGARHSNAMARRLADAAGDLPGVRITRPVESNAVFAIIPKDVAERLRKHYAFYEWDERTGEVRWMCAFDTSEEDVTGFAAALAEELAR